MGIINKVLGNAGEVPNEKLENEYSKLLMNNEQIDKGFKLFRDVFMFTNKRLIIISKQGVTGRKIEYFSLPYKSISRYSIETTGTFDLDAELKIWISSETNPTISKKFDKSVNIYQVQKLLTEHICG